MSCDEARELLHGYLDGELDLSSTLEFERHMHSCPACERAYTNQTVLRSAIREQAPYFKAPAKLKSTIRPIPWAPKLAIAAAIALMIAGRSTLFRFFNSSSRLLSPSDVIGTFSMITIVPNQSNGVNALGPTTVALAGAIRGGKGG